MNIILIITEIILVCAGILIMYKLFKKEGLYYWSVISIILNQILTIKKTNILEIDISLGIVLYASIFVCMNFIIQKYGKEEIRKLVIITLTTSILSKLIIILLTIYDSNTISEFNLIFRNNIRPYLAFIISYVISSVINANIYTNLRLEKNIVLINNIITILLSQLIDTLIFMIIAYIGNITIGNFILGIFINLIIKYLTCITGTTLMYLETKAK